MRRWARRVWYYLPAVAVFVGAIVLWEAVVSALALQAFILPRPSAILQALVERWDLLSASAQATLFEASEAS